VNVYVVDNNGGWSLMKNLVWVHCGEHLVTEIATLNL